MQVIEFTSVDAAPGRRACSNTPQRVTASCTCLRCTAGERLQRQRNGPACCSRYNAPWEHDLHDEMAIAARGVACSWTLSAGRHTAMFQPVRTDGAVSKRFMDPWNHQCAGMVMVLYSVAQVAFGRMPLAYAAWQLTTTLCTCSTVALHRHPYDHPVASEQESKLTGKRILLQMDRPLGG